MIKLFIFLCLLGALVSAQAATLGGNMGFGNSVDCGSVKRDIIRQWADLRDFFRPDQRDLKRPRSREFFCVSAQYTHNAMPARRFSTTLQCYTDRGTRFCCDQQERACAGIN